MPRTKLLTRLQRMTHDAAGVQGTPSEDLTTVYRLPTEYHRKMILTMCERMTKQISAAKNTVGAIDDAAPHALDGAQRAVDDLTRIFSVQLDGFVQQPDPVKKTPIEEAIEQADAAPFEALHDTHGKAIDGSAWADDVPEPRPRVGAPVFYPDGSSRAIFAVESYDYEGGAFGVRLVDGSIAGGKASIYYAPSAKEWRDVAVMASYADDATIGKAHEPASVSDNAPGNAASTSLDDYSAGDIARKRKAKAAPAVPTGKTASKGAGKGASKSVGKGKKGK